MIIYHILYDYNDYYSSLFSAFSKLAVHENDKYHHHHHHHHHRHHRHHHLATLPEPSLSLDVTHHPIMFDKCMFLTVLYFCTNGSMIDGLAVSSLSRIPKVRGSTPPLGTLGNVSETCSPGLPKPWNEGNMGR